MPRLQIGPPKRLLLSRWGRNKSWLHFFINEIRKLALPPPPPSIPNVYMYIQTWTLLFCFGGREEGKQNTCFTSTRTQGSCCLPISINHHSGGALKFKWVFQHSHARKTQASTFFHFLPSLKQFHIFLHLRFFLMASRYSHKNQKGMNNVYKKIHISMSAAAAATGVKREETLVIFLFPPSFACAFPRA